MRVLFDAGRYPQGAVMRLCRHLSTVLEAFTARPEQKVAEVSLLSEAELRQLHLDWAGVFEAPTTSRCLHEQFEAVAARTPKAVAVTFGGDEVSYGELNRRANRLARHLVGLGVGPDVLVGLCLNRSAELIVALLAILKAGGAYLPLDPRNPRRRLAFVLDDARAPVVVTTSELASELPTHGATVVALDLVGEVLRDLPDGDLSVEVHADNLAYVIYTSGSTGRPKGSLITHRNVSRLFSSTQPRFRFSERDVWTLFHTIAFDFSVWEIWGALLYGGRLVVVPHLVCRAPDEFLDLLAMEGVTVLNQTPSAFRQLMNAEEDRPTAAPLALRLVIFGGERLELSSLRPWFDRHGEDCPRLVNMYGITETTVHVTWRFLRRSDLETPGSLIGEPIPDLRVAILDSRRMPLPIGVAGELCVTGPGLSLGYLNREELTREKFIDSPFPVPAGERLYCSGDLARRLPDGDLEYLGRIDQQVKVRGFRIELGEIEGVLAEHPGVREGVVVARPETSRDGDETTLVAYAVPSDDAGEGVAPSGGDPHLQSDIVRQWEGVFDDSYHSGPPDREVSFDTTGWNSSYSGAPIGGDEMREWVDGTVERILALSPSRVLEIGCGTGLLAGRIAPHCDSYVATDFSQEAVAAVERLIATSPHLDHVELLCRGADDFDGLGGERFDTVVLNSVVQYFPGADYLVDVVQGAFDRLEPGGALFIGDLRSRALLSSFYASVELHRAPAATTLSQLRQRVFQRTAQEKELVLDPELFAALGDRLTGVGEVVAQLRRGRFQNEMSRFRYDMVIRKGGATAPADTPQVDWRTWDEGSSSLAGLRAELGAHRPACVGLRSVPNARLSVETELLNRLEETGTATTVAGLRSSLANAGRDAVDPEELWKLGGELSYRVEVALTPGQPGCFDAILADGIPNDPGPRLFVAPATEPSKEAKPWQAWANDPTRRLRFREFADELRVHLKEHLPDHMLPAHVVVLGALPLTANGKVDSKALPEPEASSRSGEGHDRPQGACEEILVGIWADVLGVTAVGRDDDFFDMGGHSLMATQVISRVRSAFAVDVPMRQLFATPTVSAFAADIEARRKSAPAPEGPGLVPGQAGEFPPLSFSQQRMWFLDQLEGSHTSTYNVPIALELRGPLDLEALARSLEQVVARHASLRTVFAVRDGVPYQRVGPPGPVAVELVDLADTETASRPAEARRQLRADALRPFDLSSDLMLRASAYRIGEGEHLLLLCMHHICADGWSTGVLMQELGHLYGALARGQEPEPLPELPVQYADYAVWQRQWLSGETLDGQLEYWRSRLAGSQELLHLPTDRPRPPVLKFRGRSSPFGLGEDLTHRLRLLGQRCGATLYMTLLAGFGALLHRYSGVNRVVIGTPVANRRRSEIEPLIGFFANTLALDLDCSGDPSFRGFLEQVRRASLGAYDHQDLPFEVLVEALQPHRDLGHTPLFQTMFVLQNTTVDPPRMAGLSARAVELDLGVSKFDLTMSLEEGREGLVGELQYSTDLFDAATANRIITHYRNLLAAAVERPSSRLWQLPLLDGGERTQLTATFNETTRSSANSDPLPFHVEFARRVGEAPDQPAVVARHQTVTYAELDARAESLARVLHEAGIGPEILVPVCVERGLNWVVAILAVAKAGGAFVVLDPAYPDERLAYTVADTGASILVTEEGQRHRFEGYAIQLVMADPPVASEPPHVPGTPGDTSPQHAAYAVYTSGSTGRPKGVVVTHDSLSNLIRAQVERFDIGPGDRILQFVAPTFDVAVADLGMALSSGAALCVAPTEKLLPGPGLIELMHDLEVTHLASAPSALAAVPADDFPALKAVIVGGEVCPPEVVERWAPGRRFFNCYGPTEATICATMAEYQHDGLPLTIGRPLDNVTVYILDGHGQVAPIGVAGELYIGGRGVARGYLGLSEESADRFVPDPFDVSDGARLYRTGDLARFLGDGNLEFLGRMDRQVKV
ncbi:MAG: amino acid adenylation domain-containing protein, partial [Deltaproteobacteria bacterium]|nr:amino acid adenylation domain-containing protein [Deltaproteobacteria bacterium]